MKKMKYWNNGFYETQSEQNDRFEITDERWAELLDGQSGETEIYTAADGSPDLRGRVITQEQKNMERIFAIEGWFSWYDNQVSQAARASRTGMAWSAVCPVSGRTFSSITELDNAANAYQSEIRELKRTVG
jgi:hypothetical protein